MSDYRKVQEALAAGAKPKYLCMTCPWDRYCVSPPTMTAEDVTNKMAEAMSKDEARDSDHKELPFTSLITALAVGGKDLAAEICPVMAIRLRSSAGRDITDKLKYEMKGMVDE